MNSQGVCTMHEVQHGDKFAGLKAAVLRPGALGEFVLSQAFLQNPLLVEVHWLHSGNSMTSVATQAMVTGWLLPDLWAFWDQLALDQMWAHNNLLSVQLAQTYRTISVPALCSFTRFKLATVPAPSDVLGQNDSFRISWTHLNWRSNFIQFQCFASCCCGTSHSVHGTSRLCSGPCQNKA